MSMIPERHCHGFQRLLPLVSTALVLGAMAHKLRAHLTPSDTVPATVPAVQHALPAAGRQVSRLVYPDQCRSLDRPDALDAPTAVTAQDSWSRS